MNRLVGSGLVVSLVVGLVSAPPASAAPVTLPEAQLTATLFGAAVRVKDSGFDYDKTVVGSAELVDWREKNPGATAAQAAAHAAGITKSLNDNFSATDAQLPGNEKQARLIEIVQSTPGAVFTGPQVTKLMAVLTARDLAPGTVSLHIGQRLSGAQQRFGLDMHYSMVSGDLWTAVRDKALTDQVLNDAWRGEFGKPSEKHPTGLFANWTLADFKKFGVLKDLVDIDAILRAAKLGEPQLYDELRKQFNKMRDKLWDENDKTYKGINDLAKAIGLPGAPNGGPTKEQIDAARKAEKERQGVIDGIKGGLDVAVGIAKVLHPGFAKHLKSFAESIYAFATGVNTLATSLITLATATGIGASTFGAIGAAIGAVIGIIQTFSGLISGPDQTAEIQLAMMKEIRNGFRTLNSYMETMYETMNKRFDRIELGLDTIYKSMIENFNLVLVELDKVDKKLDVIHDRVLTLMSDLQGFSLQLLQQGTDHDRDAFFAAADFYTDYEHVNKVPLSNYEGDPSFTKAAGGYAHAANNVSRYASLVFTNPNERNLDLALKNGPAGAIDYLSGRAGLPGFGVVVPNADFWAEAARAYAILSMQNPAHATKETGATGSERIRKMLANADLIQQAAARISQPLSDPDKATNPIFQNLLADYQNKVNAFVEELKTMQKRPETMSQGHQFDLFGNYDQPVDVNTLPAPPDTVPSCAGPQEKVIKRPDFLTGKNLPPGARFGLYATADYTSRWTYQPCWTSPRWDRDPYNKMIRSRTVNPGTEDVYIEYTMQRLAPHRANFVEQVRLPNGDFVSTQTTSGLRDIPLCTWKSIDTIDLNTPAGCPERGDAKAAMSDTWGSPRLEAWGDPTWAAMQLLNERRAIYYDLVAAQFSQPGGIQSAKDLRDSARLLDAYTRVGFARSYESDDQLRALLAGANSVTNLAAIYTEEAKNLRADKRPALDNPLLDNEQPDGCEQNRLPERDTIARCVQADLTGRKDRLAGRYEIHSRNLREGKAKQDLPLVAEAARNLRIIDAYYRARFTG